MSRGVLQHRDQGVQVVAVDRADVVEAQLLEEGAAGDHAAGVFLGLAGRFLQRASAAASATVLPSLRSDWR